MYSKIIYTIITIAFLGVVGTSVLNFNEKTRIEEAKTSEMRMSKKSDDGVMTFYFFKQHPVHVQKICIDGKQWLLTNSGDIEPLSETCE